MFMTPSFRLLSSLDPTADPARNQEWPANIKGFRSFRHVESGLTVNLANIAGPLYTMGVVVPVGRHLSLLFIHCECTIDVFERQ